MADRNHDDLRASVDGLDDRALVSLEVGVLRALFDDLDEARRERDAARSRCARAVGERDALRAAVTEIVAAQACDPYPDGDPRRCGEHAEEWPCFVERLRRALAEGQP